MNSNRDYSKHLDENDYLNAVFISVIGERDEQQDCYGYEMKPDEALFVVCDGMGGIAGGRAASETAVKCILERYRQADEIIQVQDFLLETAREASEAIRALRTPEGAPVNAGTTLVAILVRGRQMYWSSVGDSRAYLFRGGQLVQFTLDHTYRTVLNGQLKAGMINLEEFTDASASRKAEALVSYLGMNPFGLFDSGDEPIDLFSGDKVFIMTDGLYKLVSDEEIRGISENFSNDEEIVNVLNLKAIRAAKKLSVARDNMTIALLHIK